MKKKIMVTFNLKMGCLADPIEEQLNKQGLTLGENAERIQASVDSISRLYVQDLLTEAETERARKRLCRFMAKEVLQLKEAEH